MIIEIVLSAELLKTPKWDFKEEIRKDLPKYCKSKFDEIEELEMERERLFRLLLEEVQKNN